MIAFVIRNDRALVVPTPMTSIAKTVCICLKSTNSKESPININFQINQNTRYIRKTYFEYLIVIIT